MDGASVETVLDDVLSRAQRLETRNPFTIQLSGPNILQSTRQILATAKYTEDDLISGQLLLAQNHADMSRTAQVLRDIDTSRSLTDELISFNERTTAVFQNAIVSSICATQEVTDHINEDFIFKALGQQRKESEAKLHRSLGKERATVASSTIQEESGLFASATRKELLPKPQFYSQRGFLLASSADYAKTLSDAILEEELFTTSIRRPLSDTFNLISCLMKSQSTGGSHEAGVTTFLEQQMRSIVTAEVNSNLRVAERGGELGFLPTLQGYINLINHPYSQSPWAVIFYSLRCGSPETAYEYAKNTPAFDRDVLGALELRANKTAPFASIRTSLHSYFRREITSPSLDPFKALSLSVLVKESGFNDDTIITSVEDWIWLRLQISPISDDTEFARLIEAIDEDEPSNPFMRGQLLLMLGQSERAVEWFLSRDSNLDDTLHISIAAHVSALVPAEIIAPALLAYTKDVIAADPISALMYLKLIQDDNVRIDTMAKLVIEADGMRGIGLFRPYDEGAAPAAIALTPQEQQTVLITACRLAELTDQNGKAAQLYRLAQNYNKVAELACSDLARVVAGFTPISSLLSTNYGNSNYNYNYNRYEAGRGEGTVEETLRDATVIYQEIQNGAKVVDAETMEAFRELLFLAHAENDVKHQEWAAAADNVERAELFPVSKSSVQSSRQKVAAAPEVVKRVIPQAIEIAMRAYSEIFKILPLESSHRHVLVKEKAEALTDLVGLINIEINEDVQRTLLDLRQVFQ